ncbi:double-strand break repair protein AddB [Cognatiyoonia sp. IB215182]|uniref:double-strand break repair protein AddB n=1 Tax=Cognatiyoonia sp. IB215182 TaxID=3097353 RepID=UPI002A112829|nr:double-strand break repair protein AddB [Cognatiyoonia sp. IB215182]MDX8353226.1 double-strand break repair protein AddB [Cognatiyoonia sp. IB215182]
MFESTSKPRVFATPPGVDFADALVAGLEDRAAHLSPTDWACMEIYVNTTRMQRRVREVFDHGPPRLLPRIRLITDLANDPTAIPQPAAISPLRRRLELSRFVSLLLAREPDLAPPAALYDLSDSLANLMDEMQGEGVSPAAIRALDVADQSGHWERSLKFLNIIAPFFEDGAAPPDQGARQRRAITALAEKWAQQPVQHPVIVAGSTGSRGATALFMDAVARLPQGAIILPGFDFDLPDAVWGSMGDAMQGEDHPQFRFRRLMDRLEISAGDVNRWSAHRPSSPARNAMISLSLRPAPVTDQWLEDGPDLGDLREATEGLTLVEAPSPREEADAIALVLRKAAQDGKTAALISPDRMLTRQVTAALDRWDIQPDDSAGTPLPLSPPGRLLRHVGEMMAKPPDVATLLTLLKHPLCHSEREDRGDHLRNTRELELHLRKIGPRFPSAKDLQDWAQTERQMNWVRWVQEIALATPFEGETPLTDHLEHHLNLAERVCAGPGATGSGGLWKEAAGREAQRICTTLRDAADAAGPITAFDYVTLFGGVLSTGTVRDRDKGHPQILIWGTLEARVQSADLTILGGLNEGSWPEAPPPDPWLNRAMRMQAGLLLPERKIGLSAHDYQQAVCGKEVWITRAKRSADAETVPARWVNRLTNLLSGLLAQNGPEALAQMRAHGQTWLHQAAVLSAPMHRVDPAPRPSPCPPIAARPRQLSVTQIKTLIRDPFAIYARKVLQLQPLNPLVANPDAPLRGTIIHAILERFIAAKSDPTDREGFMQMARAQFLQDCPWPTIRAQWLARLDRTIDTFLEDEAQRQVDVARHLVEQQGRAVLPGPDMTLTCKADRIDVMPDDGVIIYDYKTGAVPTGPQQEQFDKQLLLEAAMVEKGAFRDLGVRPVHSAAFIGVNAAMKVVQAPLDKNPVDQVWADLETLFQNWLRADRGYTARMALFSKTDSSPYDHLSRFGEWDTSDRAKAEQLT